MNKLPKDLIVKLTEKMNKLPKDLIVKLTEELSPQDFVNFCASNTSENVVGACNVEELWGKRLKKDFPYISGEQQKFKNRNKELYLGVFSRISGLAEEFTEEILDGYGEDMQRFITPDFKKFLYDNFYKFLNQILQYIITKRDYKYVEENYYPGVAEIYSNDEFMDFRSSYFPGGRDDERDYRRFEDYWGGRIEDPIHIFVDKFIKFLGN